MVLEYVFTALTCGHNCSGFSSCVTASQLSPSGARTAKAICLINAGDSVQKFCNENRIKLNSGAEALTIIAPPGIKGLLDAMIPFTNKKYPLLHVHEVTETLDNTIINLEPYFKFDITAVCHKTNQKTALALACSVTMPLNVASVSHAMPVAFLPYAQAYSTFPSLPQLCNSYCADTHTPPLLVFIPLQSGGGILPQTSSSCTSTTTPLSVTQHNVSTSAVWRPPLPPCPPPRPPIMAAFAEDKLVDFLNGLCKRHNACGLFVGLARSSDSIEFRQSQLNICQLCQFNTVTSVGMLPSVSSSLQTLYETDVESQPSRTQWTDLPWCSELPTTWNDAKLVEFISDGKVVPIQPLLSVNLSSHSSVNKRNDEPVNSHVLPDTVSCVESGGNDECDSDESSSDDSSHDSSSDSSSDTSSDSSSCASSVDSNEHDSGSENCSHFTSAIVDNPSRQLAQVCLSREEHYKKMIAANTTGDEDIGLVSDVSACNHSKAHALRNALKRKRCEGSNGILHDHDDHQNLLKECVNSKIAAPPAISPPSPFDGVITFLGTGCATPSKHRSSSCIVFQLPIPPPSNSMCQPSDRNSTIIIDAGESCLAQLYQSYAGNMVRVHQLLRSISVIWISHHHADHHCGLPMLLEELQRVYMVFGRNPRGKVLVIAPKSVLVYQEYCACIAGYDDIVEFLYINQTCQNLCSYDEYCNTSNVISLATGNLVSRLESVPVLHCKDSFGLVLHCWNGEKVVYSGDCRPSQSLIRAGRDCQLLIHEATFDDSLSADAICKKHCTVSEALGVGHDMNAKFVVLTHFSQRYPKSILIDDDDHPPSSGEVSSNYVLAHDFLRFSFPSQIKHLQVNLRYAESLNEKVDASLACE